MWGHRSVILRSSFGVSVSKVWEDWEEWEGWEEWAVSYPKIGLH